MTTTHRDVDEAIRPRRPTTLQLWALRRITPALKRLRRGALRVTLPDGSEHRFGALDATPAAMTVYDWGLFPRLLRDGDIGLGEAYTDGQWEAGDLTEFIALFHRNPELIDAPEALPNRVSGLLHRLSHLARANTIARSRRNIEEHYDLGDRLFELLLDPSLSYSCGLYRTGNESLEQAQAAKRAAIIEKLHPSPESHVLEIGCGWGALAVDIARETGCRVTGITLSSNQLARARERVAAAGLADRVTIELCDYRHVQGQFDRIVSVEMIEAVGHRFLGAFFAGLDRLLAPDGVVVLQGITVPDQRYERYRKGVDWLRKHIFPGGHAPSLTALCNAMTAHSRLLVESVENIGPSYAPTLACWRANLERNAAELERRGYDARFQRTWRYYFSYCEAGFRERTFGDLQLVLTRPNNRSLEGRAHSVRRPQPALP